MQYVSILSPAFSGSTLLSILLTSRPRSIGFGDTYYFDGSKIPSRLELLRTEIPDIKLIHMVRHPGAILYHDQRFGTYNVESRLAHWIRFQRRSRKFQSILGSDNYLAVLYEKIVQEPAIFLRRVASFLNMQDIQLDDAGFINRSKVHILGNAMRENVQQIIDYSNIWREHVPAESQTLADRTFHNEDWAVDMYNEWDVN